MPLRRFAIFLSFDAAVWPLGRFAAQYYFATLRPAFGRPFQIHIRTPKILRYFVSRWVLKYRAATPLIFLPIKNCDGFYDDTILISLFGFLIGRRQRLNNTASAAA